MNTLLQFLYKTDGKIDACVDYTRPSLAIDIVILKKAFLDAKKRGVKLRYATEITKDNISYCKQMMTMVDELRHLDGIKGNFYISETGFSLLPLFMKQENRQSKSSIAMSKKSSSIKSMFLKPYGVKLSLQSSGYKRLKKELKLNFMKLSLTTKKQARSLLI